MPLHEHCRKPIDRRLAWQGFNNTWAVALADQFNGSRRRRRYFADVRITFRGDVQLTPAARTTRSEARPGFEPTLQINAIFPNECEVVVYDTAMHDVLVAVIVLVSPTNKATKLDRGALVAKCVNYLRRGIGVMVVDVVTNRRADLSRRLVTALGGPILNPRVPMAASAYRPVWTKMGGRIDVWHTPLALGDTLPIMPLGLRNAGLLPIDLEAAYRVTCERRQIA